ncbi:MAG: ATP-binding protein [Oscillospiraceae bacterium]|nr:ATP-binding protein [Oscillospiraceae bacterium]
MYELNLDATIENLDPVIAFLDDIMEQHDVPMKAKIQLDVAAEEIYVNIAHYAYPKGPGTARIEVELPEDNSQILIRFIDKGQPYNPLEKADPDITLSAEERPIGGLGIYMVKKSMDDVSYAYEDGCNILTIVKCF